MVPYLPMVAKNKLVNHRCRCLFKAWGGSRDQKLIGQIAPMKSDYKAVIHPLVS